MRYYEDLTNKTKDDMVMMRYYEGYDLLSEFDQGTVISQNQPEMVDVSVWSNDAELSEVRLSAANAVGDRYMIYQCGMYRKLEDEYSTIQLKVGDSIPWKFGYKVFQSKNHFDSSIADVGEGNLLVMQSASTLFTTLATTAAVLSLLSF